MTRDDLGDQSQRRQLRERELARALHRLAPLDDPEALLLLEGAVEEGWLTATDVALATRVRACTAASLCARNLDGSAGAASH